MSNVRNVLQRVVYPNAPIVLTAVEIRHTACEPVTAEQRRTLQQALADVAPVQADATHVVMSAVLGQPQGSVEQRQIPRFTRRDACTAVTYRDDAVVIETTDHIRYEHIRLLVETAVKARLSISAPTVTRIGIRYLNEVRTPVTSDIPQAWSEWVDPSLCGPMHLDGITGLTVDAAQGVMVLRSGSERGLLVRYGPGVGYAFESTPQLRRPSPPPGPFFLIDIDSFSEPAYKPELTVTGSLQVLDTLHEPIWQVFESVITDRLRREVLQNV